MRHMGTWTGYLGTYTSPGSAGIYRFTIDRESGALTAPQLWYPAADCKYLSLFEGMLASPVQKMGAAGLCVLSAGGDTAFFSGACYEERSAACHVVQDGERVYTANYHQGLVLVYRKTSKGPALEERIAVAPGAGCHQVLLHGRFLLVPCLLQDRIIILDRDRAYRPAGEIPFDRGTGPRHGVLTRDQRTLFVVSELSNELFRFRLAGEASWTLSARRRLEVPGTGGGPPPASAAIRLSRDERYLYTSTRFANVLSVHAVAGEALTPVQQTACGGDHPRDLVLTEDGRFLLAANRRAGGLVCFPVDRKSGRIGVERSRVAAPEAVSIVLAPQILEKGSAHE